MFSKDIEYLNKVINIKTKKDLYSNYFCWLYPFTNENICGYYSKINFKDKNIITVTSSGDHLLNACLLGAKKIDSFDSNPLAKYYSELKIAAIKSLSYEEFLIFFNEGNIIIKNKLYFNKKIYDKLKDNLEDNYRKFWDYFFYNYDVKYLKKTYLFTTDYLDFKRLVKVNNYLVEENYYKLRHILKENKINYIDAELNDLSKLNKKYDVILLSNIPAYFNKENEVQSIKKLKSIIDSLSYENSDIVVCYLYADMLNSINEGIYNKDLIEKYFIEEGYRYLYFKSSNKVFNWLYDEDAVLIKKKTN